VLQWQTFWALNIVAINGTKVVTSSYNNFKQIIMNTKLLLLAVSVAAFSSCTTLYKSGQTPDDVYYSPVRSYGEERQVKQEEQRDEVKTYSHEDRTIRLGINDPRWRNFDNDYRYSPYYYGFNYGYYYNPYFWPYPVFSPVFTVASNPKNTTPRMANLGGYNTAGTVKTYTSSKTGTVPARSYNNSNKGSTVGNIFRQIITPANTNNSNYNNTSNSNTNSSSNNTRSYTPSTSSSSSSSSGGSSSGGAVSRPPRGGGK
jgi:uncharacterized membrane protein YgcG